MKKNTNIYSIEYYLPKASKPGKNTTFNGKQRAKKPLKILVQDHVKDSVYLIDA